MAADRLALFCVGPEWRLQPVPAAELVELLREYKARAPVVARLRGLLQAPIEEWLREKAARPPNATWRLKTKRDGAPVVLWEHDVQPVIDGVLPSLRDLEEFEGSGDVAAVKRRLDNAFGVPGGESSCERPQHSKLFAWLKERVFYASHRLSVVPDDDEDGFRRPAAANMEMDEPGDELSLRLRVDRQTLWKISARGDSIAMQCSFDTRGFSRDCGRQALADQRPAVLLHPASMSPARAGELSRKRQPVFMGTGPKRERELLVASLQGCEHTHVYVQLKPEDWDQVALRQQTLCS